LHAIPIGIAESKIHRPTTLKLVSHGARPIVSRLLAVIAIAPFAACATRYFASPGSTAIAPGVEFAIPMGSELGYSVEATQLITARFRDKTQTFQAYLSVSPNNITLIAFDPFGGRALTIVATNAGIHTEAAPIVPAVLKPGNILADVAIVYWPASVIRQGLAGTSATLYEDQSERTISIGGREVVRVSYKGRHRNTWAKAAYLHNIAYGYELDLRSVTDK
jgi:hypothetical protein